MDESALTTALAKAGLVFRGLVDRSVPLVPPAVAGFANSVLGDFHDAVEVDDPDKVAKVNALWHRLCLAGGLLTEDHPEFLLAVDCSDSDWPRVWWWARVALTDRWDIAGDGVGSGV